MDFLKQLQKIEVKDIYKNDDMKIMDINGYKAIEENDKLVILPYLVNKRGLLFKYEQIPSFELKQKGISHYLTTLQCDISEDLIESVKIGLKNNFGIIPFLDEKITISNPIFLTKSQTTQYHFAFVSLYTNEYEEIDVSEFQTLEMKDKNAFVGLDDLDNCVFYDLITQYSLDLFKKEILIF